MWAAKHRAGRRFSTEHVWTFQLYQHFVDMGKYELNMIYKFDLTRNLDGQPLQFMVKDRYACCSHMGMPSPRHEVQGRSPLGRVETCRSCRSWAGVPTSSAIWLFHAYLPSVSSAPLDAFGQRQWLPCISCPQRQNFLCMTPRVCDGSHHLLYMDLSEAFSVLQGK